MTVTQVQPTPPSRSAWVGAVWFRIRRVFSYVWLLVALVALWEWRGRRNPSLFIPTPSTIADRFHEIWFSGTANQLFLTDDFRDHVGASLGRWIIGYAIAGVVGIALGMLLAQCKRINWMVQPAIRLAQSTPSIMLIPLAIVLLGITARMTISVIVYASLWPVLVNTIAGISNVERSTIDSARAMRLSGWRFQVQVLLRAASPQILAGLRVALGVSIILMVGSELYAASEGIGFYILLAQRTLRYADMFAGILMAAIIGVLANLIFQLVERRVLRWVPKVTEQ